MIWLIVCTVVILIWITLVTSWMAWRNAQTIVEKTGSMIAQALTVIMNMDDVKSGMKGKEGQWVNAEDLTGKE